MLLSLFIFTQSSSNDLKRSNTKSNYPLIRQGSTFSLKTKRDAQVDETKKSRPLFSAFGLHRTQKNLHADYMHDRSQSVCNLNYDISVKKEKNEKPSFFKSIIDLVNPKTNSSAPVDKSKKYSKKDITKHEKDKTSTSSTSGSITSINSTKKTKKKFASFFSKEKSTSQCLLDSTIPTQTEKFDTSDKLYDRSFIDLHGSSQSLKVVEDFTRLARFQSMVCLKEEDTKFTNKNKKNRGTYKCNSFSFKNNNENASYNNIDRYKILSKSEATEEELQQSTSEKFKLNKKEIESKEDLKLDTNQPTDKSLINKNDKKNTNLDYRKKSIYDSQNSLTKNAIQYNSISCSSNDLTKNKKGMLQSVKKRFSFTKQNPMDEQIEIEKNESIMLKSSSSGNISIGNSSAQEKDSNLKIKSALFSQIEPTIFETAEDYENPFESVKYFSFEEIITPKEVYDETENEPSPSTENDQNEIEKEIEFMEKIINAKLNKIRDELGKMNVEESLLNDYNETLISFVELYKKLIEYQSIKKFDINAYDWDAILNYNKRKIQTTQL